MRGSAARARILFVINSLAGGGAERVMLALLAASQERLSDYDFSLALLDREDMAYTPPEWLPLHQLDGRFSLPRSVMELRRLMAREKPDLTLSFLTRSNISTVLLRLLNGHRAIISERANTSGHFKPGLSGRVARQMIKQGYPRANAIVAPSQGIANDLVANFGCHAQKVRTISNPVDIAGIRARASETPAIALPERFAVAVSRLTKGKNVRLLVEGLAQSDTDIPLILLGQGPEQESVKQAIESLGLSGRVTLAGFHPNPYPIVARAACYLSGSNGEGFPNSLVEAMALGVPVVSTNCPSGPSEILADKAREDVAGIEEGPFGLLVPQNDASAMATAISRILQPELAARYAEAGKLRAAEYSLENARDRFWDLIETTLDRRAA